MSDHDPGGDPGGNTGPEDQDKNGDGSGTASNGATEPKNGSEGRREPNANRGFTAPGSALSPGDTDQDSNARPDGGQDQRPGQIAHEQ